MTYLHCCDGLYNTCFITLAADNEKRNKRGNASFWEMAILLSFRINMAIEFPRSSSLSMGENFISMIVIDLCPRPANWSSLCYPSLEALVGEGRLHSQQALIQPWEDSSDLPTPPKPDSSSIDFPPIAIRGGCPSSVRGCPSSGCNLDVFLGSGLLPE